MMLWLRKSTRSWLRSLVATTINGFASGVVLLVADPIAFNFNEGLHKLLATSSIFALIGLANFLKQHPLPESDDVMVFTQDTKDKPQ